MKPRGQKPQAEEVHNAAEYAECACFTCPSQEACKAAQEAAQTVPAEEKIDFSNVEIEPLFQDFVDMILPSMTASLSRICRMTGVARVANNRKKGSTKHKC